MLVRLVLARGDPAAPGASGDMRIVAAPDVREQLGTRAVWMFCDRAVVEHAVARRALARLSGIAKAPVHTPPRLADWIESELRRLCCELLAQARAAGACAALGDGGARGDSGGDSGGDVLYYFAPADASAAAQAQAAALNAQRGCDTFAWALATAECGGGRGVHVVRRSAAGVRLYREAFRLARMQPVAAPP